MATRVDPESALYQTLCAVAEEEKGSVPGSLYPQTVTIGQQHYDVSSGPDGLIFIAKSAEEYSITSSFTRRGS